MMRTVARLTLAFSAFAFVLAIGAAFAQAPAQEPAPVRSKFLPPPAPEDVGAIPADAEKSPSGLAWKVLTPAKSALHPWPTDKVTLEINAWTSKGRAFKSTTQAGKPDVYTLGTITSPKGLLEAIGLMTLGEKRRFWMPENIAFEGAANKPEGMCVFDIELVSLQPQVPADVAAPPSDAKKTKSGLAYKVLHNGNGDKSPTRLNTVVVHYTGFKTDGTMFDTSRRLPGAGAELPLEKVIPGWTEGMQLMKVGDLYRFWIPANLAYGDRGGQDGLPAGTLVFDVELLAIK